MFTDYNRIIKIILLLTSIIFLFLEIKAVEQESLTWDENQHFKIGYAGLVYNDYSTDPLSGVFISQIVAFPTVLMGRLENIDISPSERLFYSRLSVSFLTLLCALCIFSFSEKLLGIKTATISFILFLFEPTIFANSHYITLDIGFTLFFFLTYWLFLILIEKKNRFFLVITAFSTGLLLGTKVSSLSFLGVTLIGLISTFKNKFKKVFSIKKLCLFLLITLLGLWFTYKFTFASLGGFTEGGVRHSNIIEFKLKQVNPLFSEYFKKALSLKMPLGDYLRIVKNSYVYSLSKKQSFFLGKLRNSPGIFYPILLIIKLPLSFIISFFIGIHFLKNKQKRRILLIPIVSILVFVFIFNNINLRLRYILPIYPFLTIISAYGIRELLRKEKIFKITGYLFLLWYFLNFSLSFPHNLSFHNELVSLFAKPYLVLSDSNIDWGQGLIDLKEYARSKDIGVVNLSYFGTDDPNEHGFKGYARRNICQKPCTIEPTIIDWEKRKNKITALSITNWQECGFYKTAEWNEQNIKKVVGGSILIF